MEMFSIGYALLSIQSALLGAVTPALRAVVIDLSKKEGRFFIKYYYEGDVSEDIIELWRCVSTEAGDLGPDCRIEEDEIIRSDYPEQIVDTGYCAYYRKEPENKLSVSKTINLLEYADILPEAYGLLCVQSALLGKVTPELRSVIVDVSREERVFYVRFYYDGEVSEQIIDLWKGVAVEANKAMGLNYFVDSGVERVDYPKEVPFRGRLAYRRKEKSDYPYEE